MARLTTSDTENSRAPDSDQHAGTALGAVAIVNGSIPDFGQVKDLLVERFTPTYDISPHVHRTALPMPGDEGELSRAIAYALEKPLDPDRPPWECWIIEGLQDHRWAILIKIGQGLAEDLPPAHLLAQLCDNADYDTFANHAAADEVSPVDTPSWTDTVWQVAARAVTGALRRWPAGNQPPTRRRYRTVIVPRDAVDHISRKFGVTADDVAFAAITEGFRSVLLQRGEQPRADSVRVPGSALPYLPVEQHDPVQQLRAVRTLSNRAYQRSAAYTPFTLYTKAIQSLTRPPQHVVTLAAAAPGPRYRLRLMGQRIERLLPIPPIAQGTGVAVLSYGDELVFGITTDYDGALNIDQLAAGIDSGMARLVALSRDSVVLFERRRKRRTLPNSATRWRPPTPPARVRH